MITDLKADDVAWAFDEYCPPQRFVVVDVLARSGKAVCEDVGGRDDTFTCLPLANFYATEREAQQAYFEALKGLVRELNDSIVAVLDRLAVLEAEAEEPPR